MLTERDSLIAAVNALATQDNALELYADLRALLPSARALSARFSGERAVLNPLVSLAVNNPEQFESVIQLVERKRSEAGLPALKAPEGGFDKTDYMREFMQAKRERERRAVDIENLIRPAHDRLKGRARLDYMQKQSSRWKDQRDALLDKRREAAGRRLAKEEITETLTAFWSGVDRELDELEALAKAESIKPTHLRKRR